MFNINLVGKTNYILKALNILVSKGSVYSMKDDDYSTMDWDVDNVDTKPTEAEIAAKAEELRLADEYILPRKAAYPSLGDQLDMLFHAIEAGTLDTTSEFFTTLKAVKDANPKA